MTGFYFAKRKQINFILAMVVCSVTIFLFCFASSSAYGVILDDSATDNTYDGRYLIIQNTSDIITNKSASGSLYSQQAGFTNPLSSEYFEGESELPEDVQGLNVVEVEERNGYDVYQLSLDNEYDFSQLNIESCGTVNLNQNIKYSRFEVETSLVGTYRTFIASTAYNSQADYYYNLPATCVYDSSACTIYIEDENSDALTTAQINAIGDRFTAARDAVYDNFGEYMSNSNNGEAFTTIDDNTYYYINGKITILLHDIRDDEYEDNPDRLTPVGGYSYTGGYFSAYDINSAAYNGNNAVMVHVDLYPLLGFKDTISRDPVRALSVIVHEFQHTVNFSDSFLPYLTGQADSIIQNELWWNEMMSMAAEDMLTNIINAADPSGVDIAYSPLTSRISHYNSSASSSTSRFTNGTAILTYTGYSDNGNDIAVNYSLPYMFGQYLRYQTEGYNGGGAAIYKKILESDYTDYQAIEEALAEVGYPITDFDDVCRNFWTSLLLNQESGIYSFGRGELGLTAYNNLVPPICSTDTSKNIPGTGVLIFDNSGNDPVTGGGTDIRYLGVESNSSMETYSQSGLSVLQLSLTKDGYLPHTLDSIKASDATVNAAITINNTSAAKNMVLVLVWADASGKITVLNYVTDTVGGTAADTITLQKTINLPSMTTGGKLKLMLLDDAGSLHPLTAALKY